MDERLLKVVNQKIGEVFENTAWIKTVAGSLGKMSSDDNAFACGIVIGRLYNSFHYQCRRILSRDPTDDEFTEFVGILVAREREILGALKWDGT